MTRAAHVLVLAMALVAGCGRSRDTAPRIAGDGGATDAPARAIDAADPADAGTPRALLGPVVPGAGLDGIDRTRDPACPGSARWVVGVVGRVLDELEAPRSGVLAQTCLRLEGGRSVCLAPARTDDEGVFTIVLGESLRCVHEVALRVLDPHARVTTLYASAPAQPDDGVVFASADLVLYALRPASALPPIGDPALRRSVAFPGAELTIAPAMLEEDGYASLSARVLRGDEAASASFLGEGETFTLLAAFGPESRVDAAAPAAFRLTDTGLPPGARASLFVLSGLYTLLPDGTTAREGHWLPLAEVTVGEGGVITTPPGVGLTSLGWVGVAALP